MPILLVQANYVHVFFQIVLWFSAREKQSLKTNFPENGAQELRHGPEI